MIKTTHRNVGEQNGRAKLSESTVRFLRRKKRKYGDLIKLAKEYGVSKSTMNQALNGHAWMNVE